jgi:TRAP-type transport system periplasmic protein
MLLRNFAACAALSCWAMAFAVGDGNARELRLSHQLPEADARHRAARVLAAEMKKRVPDLPISVHPNASLVKDPPQQYEAMLEGKIEMAIYPMGYASAKFPELSVVTMPGVPSSAETANLLKGSEFEELLQRLCEEKGFRILAWWWLDGGMASRTKLVTGPPASKGWWHAAAEARTSTACSRPPGPASRRSR